MNSTRMGALMIIASLCKFAVNAGIEIMVKEAVRFEILTKL